MFGSGVRLPPPEVFEGVKMKLATALMIYFAQTPTGGHDIKAVERIIERSRLPISGLFCRDNLSAISKYRTKKKQSHIHLRSRGHFAKQES